MLSKLAPTPHDERAARRARMRSDEDAEVAAITASMAPRPLVWSAPQFSPPPYAPQFSPPPYSPFEPIEKRKRPFKFILDDDDDYVPRTPTPLQGDTIFKPVAPDLAVRKAMLVPRVIPPTPANVVNVVLSDAVLERQPSCQEIWKRIAAMPPFACVRKVCRFKGAFGHTRKILQISERRVEIVDDCVCVIDYVDLTNSE